MFRFSKISFVSQKTNSRKITLNKIYCAEFIFDI